MLRRQRIKFSMVVTTDSIICCGDSYNSILRNNKKFGEVKAS